MVAEAEEAVGKPVVLAHEVQATAEVEAEVEAVATFPVSATVEVVATFRRSAKMETATKAEATMVARFRRSAKMKAEAGVNATAEGYTYRHLSHFRHICLLACGSSTVSVHSKFLANTCRRTSS